MRIHSSGDCRWQILEAFCSDSWHRKRTVPLIRTALFRCGGWARRVWLLNVDTQSDTLSHLLDYVSYIIHRFSLAISEHPATKDTFSRYRDSFEGHFLGQDPVSILKDDISFFRAREISIPRFQKTLTGVYQWGYNLFPLAEISFTQTAPGRVGGTIGKFTASPLRLPLGVSDSPGSAPQSPRFRAVQ
jgi:hypothetical protein